MKIQKNILIFLLSIIFIYINHQSVYALNNNNVDLEILQEMGGSVQEYGIRVVVTKCEKNQDEVIEKFERTLGMKKEIKSNDGIININFQFTNGYIEFTKENQGTVIMDITERKSYNDMTKLKSTLECEFKKFDFKIYYYIKAEIDNNDINKYKDEAENIIKKYALEDVNVEKLSSGYFLSANLGSNMGIKSGNKIIDFNCDIFKYSSGTYLIIGVPINYINF
ncbi:hypothetical protein IAI10_02780 [Clostridium sp. 19966]|uniref:hypothetical protein n=1 Tax=Clostridium sp. 19966 TaxID=2768166 RepID=UPI0028DDDB31|nr:hypothetical protein [Clostridium sp. 19966]MDT8715582.1 hypothetical protein [Clostridium sp. 19966]